MTHQAQDPALQGCSEEAEGRGGEVLYNIYDREDCVSTQLQ